MKLKVLQKIFILLIGSILLFSCKKTLDINQDPTTPTTQNITVEALFPSGVMFSAAAIGGDLQLIGSIWAQHYTQWSGSSQYRSIDAYDFTISSYNGIWSLFYAGAIPDLDLTISLSEKQNRWNFWVAATLMKAYTYHVLTDTYGNIPFTEADKGQSNLIPKLDNSENEIYPGIITLIDNALGKINQARESENALPMGNADIVFKGDMDLWEQFAYTLKMKVLMRNYSINNSKIDDIINSGNLLTADAKVNIFIDAPNRSNPLFENDNRQLNTNQNLRGSATTVEYLNHFGDDRISKFFYPVTGTTDFIGMDQGDYLNTGAPSSRAFLSATDPVYFISLVETDFMVAEHYARNADFTNAKTWYDNGVKAAFARWGLDATAILSTDYAFTATTIGDALTQILTQKWLASVRCQAWNAFIDINRTGIPALGTLYVADPGYTWGTLTPSVNSVLGNGLYPKRMLYPKRSADYNPNAADAIKLKLTDKLWWEN